MNWDAIGAIAEMLGSIAVIVTLILLVLQLRANSAMLRNSTMQYASNATSDWVANLAGNPELHQLYRAGLNDDSGLSREDRGRFDLVLFQAFTNLSTAHQLYLDGGIDDGKWNATVEQLGVLLRTRGGRRSWERQKSMFDTRFGDVVSGLMEEVSE